MKYFKRLVVFDSGNKAENLNFIQANPTMLINRHLLDLNNEALHNTAGLIAQLTDLYANGSQATVMVSIQNKSLEIESQSRTVYFFYKFNTYDSKHTDVPELQILLFLLRGTPIALYGDEIQLKFDGLNVIV